MLLRGTKLLILFSEKENYESTEVYLTHKGVRIKTVQSVPKFLQQLEDFKPEYVVVSADHKDLNVRHIIDNLIHSAGRPICISAIETKSVQNNLYIEQRGVEYSFTPPFTGKKLEKLMSHLERDKVKNAEEINYKNFQKVKKSLTQLKLEYEQNTQEVASQNVEDDVQLVKQAMQAELGIEFDNKEYNSKEVTVSYKATNQLSLVVQTAYKSFETATKDCFSIQHPTELKRLAEFSVYAISSDKKSGYLFTVIQAESDQDKRQILEVENNILNEITKDIKADCEVHKSSMSFDLFDFQDWLLGNGGIIKSLEIGDTSVSFGFLEKEKEEITITSTADDNMVGVELNTFDPQHSVKNNVYLHFPKNNKYILYTKKGNKILDKQFTKFINLNIKELHIKKDDINSLKDYSIEKDINNKLRKYKKKSA